MNELVSCATDIVCQVFGFGWVYALVLPIAPFAIVGIIALSVVEIWQRLTKRALDGAKRTQNKQSKKGKRSGKSRRQ